MYYYFTSFVEKSHIWIVDFSFSTKNYFKIFSNIFLTLKFHINLSTIFFLSPRSSYIHCYIVIFLKPTVIPILLKLSLFLYFSFLKHYYFKIINCHNIWEVYTLNAEISLRYIWYIIPVCFHNLTYRWWRWFVTVSRK